LSTPESTPQKLTAIERKANGQRDSEVRAARPVPGDELIIAADCIAFVRESVLWADEVGEDDQGHDTHWHQARTLAARIDEASA
jgi:hypothetical protein